jgi:DNA-binding protein HU-beta
MAEQMEVSPKQVAGFFDLVIETATTQTKKLGEFTILGLGKLVKAQPAVRMGPTPATGESIKIRQRQR